MNEDSVKLMVALIGAIATILAGYPKEIQGAVLADLTATWLAGHIILDDPEATNAKREELLEFQVEEIRKLIPHNERIADIERRAREQGWQ